MDYIIALIYGIIEGITEWLPVSSTGHLILANNFLPMDKEFFEVFEVVIQLGAIMAVVLIYWSDLWPFSSKEANYIVKDKFVMWAKIFVACLPAAVIGILFDEVFEEYFYNTQCVSLALIIVGIIFICVECFNKKTASVNSISELTFKAAIIIGLFQVIAAVFPGVSRSGATIIGALLIGVSRKTAAEFTFFLAVPVMAGASLLKIVKYVAEGYTFTGSQIGAVCVGCICAFAVSMFIIKFLMSYIKKHDFKAFAIYRIVIGIVFLVLAQVGVISIM